MERKEIIVYPKSSFYIKRRSLDIHSEIPSDESAGHFCYFTKDLPYKGTVTFTDHLIYRYLISDYTRSIEVDFWRLSVFNDNFYTEGEWIKIQRDKKIGQLIW